MKHAPQFWQRSAMPMLKPLGWLYGSATRLRFSLITPEKVSVPVMCVGNVVAGGAGKTPVVIALSEALKASGRTPHILTRGYGGSCPHPTRVQAHHNAKDVGDEALLLACHAPCWVDANRVRSAHAAIAAGADILIMDDGFQNPHLYKDVSFLVIDGGYGLGNGAVMPAGALREPLSQALQRTTAVVMVGKDTHQVITRLPRKEITLLRGTIVPEIPDAVRCAPVVAFCGIGRPQKFYDTLCEHKLHVVDKVDFPDHHPFTEAELSALQAKAISHGALLVTTEKDAVRLTPEWRAHVFPIPIRLQLDPQMLLEGLLALHAHPQHASSGEAAQRYKEKGGGEQ
jgi:tetraacyldisaccharide 4'-kinase